MVPTGLIPFRFFPVSQFPGITPPEVTVTANYPGVSAHVVASTVTSPFEQQISGVPGTGYIFSVSSNNGSSTITFKVGYHFDIAAMEA